ncbi:MAG: hypothetical protein V3U75_05645 [Methylococcaceae bacterium]
MDLQEEFTNITETLQQQRDEIKLQLHLASMEAREEWENHEETWQHFQSKLEEIGDDTKETTEELLKSAKNIGEELQTAYHSIVKKLSDKS